MAELGLQIKQSQSMVMTPQLQQSIKMLQLSTLDLIPYVAQQIADNPFLETETPQTENTPDEPDAPNNTTQEPEQSWSDDEISPAIYNNDAPIYSGVNNNTHNNFNDSEYGIESLENPNKTLREHITNQININFKDPINKMIAVHLTDMLDDNGYLIHDLTPLSEKLQCDYSQIKTTLETLKTFDPAGIFASNLAECLGLQLKEKDRLDPAMQLLLNNLDLLAKHDYPSLSKICNVDYEDLKLMQQELTTLNPKPGNIFSTEHIQIIQPDVFLKQSNTGKWIIELNNDILPKVLINNRYYAEIDSKTTDKENKKFLQQHITSANWLTKALNQRANTILKVTTEIIAQQDNFFRYGIHHLKPLILSDISQAIDMHESTISRVINGKYLATHIGTYELKYFFSSSVSSSKGNEDISSKRIKFMIQELINNEKPDAILSDDKISAMLKQQGINIARRTIMKYREAMNIGSSVQRRRQKKILKQV